MDSIKNWSIHIEFLVIFFTLLGGYFHLDNKMDIQSIFQTERIDQAHARIDQINDRIDQVNSRIDQQNARSDQLYTMFIDLLKERKND